MSKLDPSEIDAADQACATERANAGDPRVAVISDKWRPPGVCISAPDVFLDVHAVTASAIAALADVTWIYQRNESLVRPLISADGKSASVLTATEYQATMAVCRNLKWWTCKYNPKQKVYDWFRNDPPPKYVRHVLEMRRYSGINVLKGILTTPSIRTDGSPLIQNGYDRESKWLLHTTVKVPPVPDKPSERQIKAAIKLLVEPFDAHAGRDYFPFATPADRWIPIAAIMTILARPAIDGCVPMFGFDATTQGSGKGRLVNIISIVCTGKVAQPQRFSAEEEELSKTLEAAADAGDNVIFFDNIKCQVRGATLEQCITAGCLKYRVLGKTERKQADWNAVICAAGNNLQFGSDMARRCYVSRLESPVERPELLDNWKHTDLLGYVRGKRSSMIWAALTILRGFIVSGQKPQCQQIGSFEEWIRLVPSAIKWATGIDLISCLYKPTVNDEKSDILALLTEIAELQDRIKMPWLSTREIIDGAYFTGYGPVVGQPLRDALDSLLSSHSRKDASGRPSSTAVGRVLGQIKGRVVGGLRLVSSYDGKNKIFRWAVEPI